MILKSYIYKVILSDPRHTQCSNLTKGRWAKYICNHENNVPSRLSQQWLCGNSCTWAHDVQAHDALGHTMYIMYIMCPIA